ncbi:MAG: dihydropteroate synthase [Alphaproteobacteria bacterium]
MTFDERAYWLPGDLDHDPAAPGPRLAGVGPAFRRLTRLGRTGPPSETVLHLSNSVPVVPAPVGPAPVGAPIGPLTQPRAPFPGFDPASSAPSVMGILNVTPDSFSDGGRFAAVSDVVDAAASMAAAGAAILDVGGESTRPGSDPVGLQEELDRVIPVIEALTSRLPVPVSIDTRKAAVMAAAMGAGAAIVNDVSALTHDPRALAVVAGLDCPVILMHAQGEPKTMQAAPTYGDVLLDVYDALQHRIAACGAAGIAPERIVVDPGIGFGKTLEHNIALLRGLALFHGLGCPVLLGASRKSFIGRLDPRGGGEPADRLGGSIAVACRAADAGIQIIRVHDVAQTVQAITVWQAMRQGRPAP